MAEAVLKVERQTQVCKCCGKELPMSEFRPSKLGILKTCKECVRQNQIKSKLDKKIAKMKIDELERTKKARLSDFTPRELMEELVRRGYEFTAKYVEVHTISSKDFKV